MRTRPRLATFVPCLLIAALAPQADADMPHNDMPHNSITLNGLTEAAPLLQAITNGRLDDATISSAVAANPSLTDPNVVAHVGPLLDKIVSCALDSHTTLNPFPGPGGTPLAGELGLCGPQSGLGNWRTTALTGIAQTKCQEAVTACVLARVNKIGHRIVISVRPGAPMPLTLQGKVPVETQYRDKNPIKSLVACSSTNPIPDCGYKAHLVGRCDAGNTVAVSAAPGTRVRICQGIYGCDEGFTPTGEYTKVIDAPGGQFHCPANGPLIAGKRWGYFSVMTQPPSDDATVQVTGADYPAPEAIVFTWPEGAFYGNIFLPNNLSSTAQGPNVNVAKSGIPGTAAERYREPEDHLAGDQHACFSPVWSDGPAVMNDRFCAGSSANCFVNQPMACFRKANDRCATNAVASGAFGNCKPTVTASSETVWVRAITTYLNDPCDLASSLEKCNEERKERTVRGQPPDPRGKPSSSKAPPSSVK